MKYIKLPLMDSEVSIFAVCQAHQQLEADYNVGGFLHERESNERRKASTGMQLARMKYDSGFWCVNIIPEEGDERTGDDEDVRLIYCHNVLKMVLPVDDELRAFMKEVFTAEYLEQFFNWKQQQPTHVCRTY